jgi:hypothetical protein
MENTFTEDQLHDWVKEKIGTNRNAVERFHKGDKEQENYYKGANDALEELLVQWQIVDKYGVI